MTYINFGTLIPLIIAILAGGAGCFLIVLARQMKRRDAMTTSWLPTQGVIISSGVKETETANGAQNGFAPLVRYQYSYNGRTYTGIRVTFHSRDYSQQQAEQIANRYAAGDSVTVYYDPHHPGESVLLKDPGSAATIRTAGLILLVLGFGSSCITVLVFSLEKLIQ